MNPTAARSCIGALLLVATMALAGDSNPSAVVRTADEPTAVSAEPSVDASRFIEAIDLIADQYVEPVPRSVLLNRALQALLAELDPYAAYLDASAWSEMRTNLSAQLGGVGVIVEIDEGTNLPRIERLFHGSPAATSGARRGDHLASINGRSLTGATIDEVLPLLRGEPGTELDLVLRRDGSDQPIALHLIRAKIELPSVRGVSRDPSGRPDFMLDVERGIGYVRISRMAEDGVQAVTQAVQGLEQRRMRALVLDLRGSTGGLMRVARELADLFIDRGPLFGEVMRDSSRVFRAEDGTITQVPIAVLIDGETVSSSEFLAAALRDAGRARFVGSRTFGKARLQQMLPLSSGGGLVLTTSRLLRGDRVALDRHDPGAPPDSAGISPDPGLEVTLSPSEYEAWRSDADLRDQGVILDPTESSPQAVDRVLARAVEVLLEAQVPR